MKPPQESSILYRWIADSADSGATCLPNGDPSVYLANLTSVRDCLRAAVYPEIGIGAYIHDGVVLTRHGDEHIETVISRATALLIDAPHSGSPPLTPYEAYLLLMAIYVHDVGNLLGRSDHEKKIALIIDNLEIKLSTETVERKTIIEIAKAHSGNVDGMNKDTISKLAETDLVRGQEVRKQALAAILRFADELADDSTRGTKGLISTGHVPPQSEVYQHYSRALHSVQVRRREYTVSLQYLFHVSDAKRKFQKGKSTVYLLDEIYSRTLKVYGECEYCMRFTHGIVRIATISAKIEVHTDRHAQHLAVPPITYQLRALGFPRYEDDDIRKHVNDRLITGDGLAQVAQTLESDHDK